MITVRLDRVSKYLSRSSHLDRSVNLKVRYLRFPRGWFRMAKVVSGQALPGPDYFDEEAKCYKQFVWILPSHILPFQTVRSRAFGKILTNCHQFCLPGKIIRSPQWGRWCNEEEFCAATATLFRQPQCRPATRTRFSQAPSAHSRVSNLTMLQWEWRRNRDGPTRVHNTTLVIQLVQPSKKELGCVRQKAKRLKPSIIRLWSSQRGSRMGS